MGTAFSQTPIRNSIEEFRLTQNNDSDFDTTDGEGYLDSYDEDKFSQLRDPDEWPDEDEFAKPPQDPMWKICLRGIGWFVLMWVLAIIGIFFVIALAFTSGNLGKEWFILWTFVAFFPMCIIILFASFASPSTRNLDCLKFLSVYFFLSFVLFLAVIQISLALMIPPSCVVADERGQVFGGASNFDVFGFQGLEIQDELHCNYTLPFKNAVDFFGCALTEEPRVYFGGLPVHFKNAQAMTIDRYVFLQNENCVSTETLVHEFVHVWQFQKGHWYGTGALPHLFSWLQQQMTNRTGMYDYGGEEGLRRAAAEGSKLSVFNEEQQATIVQHYYRSLRNKNAFNANYTKLLQQFAAPMFECTEGM